MIMVRMLYCFLAFCELIAIRSRWKQRHADVTSDENISEFATNLHDKNTSVVDYYIEYNFSSI